MAGVVLMAVSGYTGNPVLLIIGTALQIIPDIDGLMR